MTVKSGLQEVRCSRCGRRLGSYNLEAMNPQNLARGEDLLGEGFADVVLDRRDPKERHREWMQSTFGPNFIGAARPRSGTGLYVEKRADQYYLRIICRRCRRNDKVRIEKVPSGSPVYL